MYGIGKVRGEAKLLPADKKIAAISGMLLVLGNGFVCIAEMTIPSGFAAIIIGTTPIFVMLLNWWFFEKAVPQIRRVFGILVSLVGIVMLTKGDVASADSTQMVGVILLGFAILSWAIGTLTQRKAGRLPNIFSFSGYQLILGSFLVGILGTGRGEWADFDVSKITATGIMAVLYLVVFGSAVAYSSYVWLSRNIEPSKVTTYAVVNPVVAVWLGWAIADEHVDINTMLYSLVVLVGLYFVIFKPKTSADKKVVLAKS